MKTENAVVLENVFIKYPGTDRNILQDLNLEIPVGAITMVLGRNGSGKTTLLKAILGYLKPENGNIYYSPKLKTKSIAFLPQIEEPYSDLSVFDFVTLGRINFNGFLETPKQLDFIAVEQALESMGLEDLAGTPVTAISGGEFQKVRIARALVQQAALILMDEPTTFLDYRAKSEFFTTLNKIRESGLTILLSSHEPMDAREKANYVILIKENKSVIAGKTKHIMSNSNLKQTFGIEVA